ncbi:penicillin-binding protein [Rhodococcoides trifolii]|uniref:Penicillin-binding protein n=1 Tax=Rhodococcoides trifolii TaxID=908250 RepID=A0A917CMA0_9NOCA|nr:penicillin-binding transpeptidase domain-containing protein [Rhodococcus trifolii]GGF93332.1 penicillin-binding protein [Rhodococcus trifolii]
MIVLVRRHLLTLIAVTALVASACGDNAPPQPRTVADAFAAALSSGNVAAAAAETSDPAGASTVITQMFDGLRGGGTVDATPTFTVTQADEDAKSFTMSGSWSFTVPGSTPDPDSTVTQTSAPSTIAQDFPSERIWAYSTTGTAAETDQGWKIDWDPAAVVPGLTNGSTIRYTPTTADTAPRVLDGAGAELMSRQVVTLVNIDASADTSAVAALVSPIAPTVTAESLAADLSVSTSGTTTAVSLRQSDLDPIQDRLAALPGVTLAPQTRLLTTDRAVASPALSGVADLWQTAETAGAGWAVQLVGPDGTVTGQLAGQDATVGPDIATTLDTSLQLKAENALSSLPNQSAIVAIRPSTGAVLAVAQNAAADAQGPIALTGLYPPGSTFKTVTTSAALQAGTATPDTALPCPGTENIEGRQIPNDDNFDLGTVPLHTAFARSCNTTMARLAVALPDDALQQAALQFGLGVDYVTPGLTTVTGSVPPATTPAERVESGIGQGAVTATPFGMALVAASIANGSTPLPMLVQGRPATADQAPTPVPTQVTDQLKTMMRETITAGTATVLQDVPGLLGKTGTAEVANAPAHGWFVGIQGDLAFAVFVAGGNSSAPALTAAGAFLR